MISKRMNSCLDQCNSATNMDHLKILYIATYIGLDQLKLSSNVLALLAMHYSGGWQMETIRYPVVA